MKSAAARAIRFSPAGERAGPPTIARLMAMALENPRLLSLAAGFTDNRTLPVAAVQAAMAALASRPGEPEYLQYGTNLGRPRLRELLGERLRSREPALAGAAGPETMFVTNGSQQALYLAMQVLCTEGDSVFVDRPSYFVFLEMLAGLGIRARSMPVGADGRLDLPALGARLDELARSGEIARVKALYFVSYFSNPSGRSLDAGEKTGLARVLADRGLHLPVIEDAAYRDLHFRQPPETPATVGLTAWREFPLLYLATLTKPFATGLKVGYGHCTSADWLFRMACLKGHHDFGTANFTQALLEEVLANGSFDRHLAVVRPAYERKMRALHETLETEGLRGGGWRWEVPEGGLYLWLQAPATIDTGMASAFCQACIAEGVLYVPGELCFGDEPRRNCVRLSFGVLDEDHLREAGRRFARVARRLA